MVKGAAKAAATPSAGAAAGSAAATAQRLPQMGTGLNVAGNPVDNVENIHHVSYPKTYFVANVADPAGFSRLQSFRQHGGYQQPE
jgi:NADP-dependent 3-hydroxy acid dehydrogenase YdfG